MYFPSNTAYYNQPPPSFGDPRFYQTNQEIFQQNMQHFYNQENYNQQSKQNNNLSLYLNSLPENPQRLILNDMRIGDEGCFILAPFLNKNNAISVLELKGNNITGNGFIEIFQALRNNFKLKVLDLEWNFLGDNINGIEALTSFLSENRSLSHIDLKNNKILGDYYIIPKKKNFVIISYNYKK